MISSAVINLLLLTLLILCVWANVDRERTSLTYSSPFNQCIYYSINDKWTEYDHVNGIISDRRNITSSKFSSNCFVSPSKSALNRKSCDESDVKRQKSSNNNAKLASSQTVSKSLELSSDGNSSLKDSNDSVGDVLGFPIEFNLLTINSKPIVSGFSADQLQDQLQMYRDAQAEFNRRFSAFQEQTRTPQFPNFQQFQLQPTFDIAKQFEQFQQQFILAQQQFSTVQQSTVSVPQQPTVPPTAPPTVQAPTQNRFSTSEHEPKSQQPAFSNASNFPYPHWPSFQQGPYRPPPPYQDRFRDQRPWSMPETPSVSQNINEVCGLRSVDITPLIIDGANTQRGDWPWMAAVYLNKPTGLNFNCGGTLITATAVVTAAHCINTAVKNYQPHEVALQLGRFRLTDWNEVGSVSSNVQRIIVHPDFQRLDGSFDADIAILFMPTSVEFSKYIRPICEWTGNSDVGTIEGLSGTVTGWGRDSSNVVTGVLRKTDLPIVNSLTCVRKSNALVKAVSDRTFCAGTLSGDGPCQGDSGGGLFLVHENRWKLRGIVSSGVNDPILGCKLTEYVVFTDVAKFDAWIRANAI